MIADEKCYNSLSLLGGHSIGSDTLAKILWFQGAKSGNALAQSTLAHDILDSTEKLSTNAILFASALLGLAAQQGDVDAKASLSELLDKTPLESMQCNSEKEMLMLLIDLC